LAIAPIHITFIVVCRSSRSFVSSTKEIYSHLN
jgi:hypothetical protein